MQRVQRVKKLAIDYWAKNQKLFRIERIVHVPFLHSLHNPKSQELYLHFVHPPPRSVYPPRKDACNAREDPLPSRRGGRRNWRETGEGRSAQLHKGGEEEESAPDKNLIVVHGRCCCCRGGSFHTTTHHVANDSWKGEWKGRASSKLQLCRNYRAERIAGRRMRLLGGRGGVRRGSWPPFHRIRPWPPPLRDDNISWTNLDSARHLSLSLTLSIYLNFFPNLFLFLFLSLSTPLYFVAPSPFRGRGLSGRSLILQIFQPSKRGEGIGSSSPDALRIRFSKERIHRPLLISYFFYLLFFNSI